MTRLYGKFVWFGKDFVRIYASGQGEYASMQRAPEGYSREEIEEIAGLALKYRGAAYQPHLVKCPIEGRILSYYQNNQGGIGVEIEIPDRMV